MPPGIIEYGKTSRGLPVDVFIAEESGQIGAWYGTAVDWATVLELVSNGEKTNTWQQITKKTIARYLRASKDPRISPRVCAIWWVREIAR